MKNSLQQDGQSPQSSMRQQIANLLSEFSDQQLPQVLAILQKLRSEGQQTPETMVLVEQILQEDAQLLHRLAQ